jgi:hypothetical protein
VLPLNAGLGWQVLSDYFTAHFGGDGFPGVIGYPEVLSKGDVKRKTLLHELETDVFSRHLACHDIFSLAA